MQSGETVWNAGRAVGERIAFKPSEVRLIADNLRQNSVYHDLCLFTVGIDSMLRCSDLLRLKVSDMLSSDGRVRWRQKKTGRNVYPVLTASTQAAIRKWVDDSGKSASHFLFTRTKPVAAKPISAGYYRTLIKRWAASIHLEAEQYSTHSLRRTKPSFLYHYGFSDLEHIARLLGHTTTAATSRYLGIEQREAEAHALAGDIFTADLSKETIGNPLLREFLKPSFLDQFTQQIWERLVPKITDFIDENTKKGRE